MNQSLSHLIQASIRIIYPAQCGICQSDLVLTEQHVCSACAYDLPYIMENPHEVSKLNRLFIGRIDIQRVYALLNYQKGNQVQKLLHTIKYKSRPVMGAHYGQLLAKAIDDKGINAIIPIPLHPKKERKRGFNQSQAIAEGLSVQLNLPIYNKHIVRRQFNKSQTQFSRYDRYDNVRSIFQVTKPQLLENKHVLLVDDVLTTGATIESCTAELLMVKGCKVSVATLAARV